MPLIPRTKGWAVEVHSPPGCQRYINLKYNNLAENVPKVIAFLTPGTGRPTSCKYDMRSQVISPTSPWVKYVKTNEALHWNGGEVFKVPYVRMKR